jgi:hypothetical protein
MKRKDNWDVADSTRELAKQVAKKLEEKLGIEASPEEIEAWAKQLAADIANAND